MAWEDTDKVSSAVHGTPTDNPGPDQHSPWTIHSLTSQGSMQQFLVPEETDFQFQGVSSYKLPISRSEDTNFLIPAIHGVARALFLYQFTGNVF
jgi:hypothetical protein